MLSLQTNGASLFTQNALANSQKALSATMTRLGTGLRINSAMDDAAGLQIATRLDAQTRGMAVAQRNTQNGISMMQTAEGALGEVTNILQRMKDLATQSADASSSADDQKSMQAEYDSLGDELANITKNTSFGGTKLFSDGTKLDGTGGTLSAAMKFQIGASAGETMSVDATTQLTAVTGKLAAATARFQATPAAGTELTAAGSANSTITKLSDALDSVSSLRASLGAASNRLDHVFSNLQNMSTNVTQAKGRITDVDYATETAQMTSKQMQMQAGAAMLKQANGMSGMVNSLLQ